jgi:hypothetical protein
MQGVCQRLAVVDRTVRNLKVKKNHGVRHVAAGLISAVTISFSLTACDLTRTIQLELPTFQQIKHNLSRLASRVLDHVRLHSRGTNPMSTTPTPTLAQSVAAFDQSIGVNVHMSYTWTDYANVALVESDLAYLGVDNVRDTVFSTSNVQTDEQLAAAGIKFDLFLPVYLPSTVNLPEFIGLVNAVVQADPGSVSAIEGPNEVNFIPAQYAGGTTLADQATLQEALYAAVRADPNLAGVPVYNLTLGSTDSALFEDLGNLSSAANYGNEHAYAPDWSTPASGISYLLSFPGIDTPGLPEVITETGYETNAADTYSGVDQTVQAKLTLDTLLDAFKDGVPETYLYELFDEGGQYFGLFNAEGAPKLVATAIHNLTTMLSDPGATSSFTPGSLSYAVANLPTDGNQLLLEKSTGTFDLVLWDEADIWNPTTASEIAAPTQTSTVEFAQTQSLVLVFDPLLGTAPIAAYLNTQSIQVTLSDHPIIVEVPSNAPTLVTPTINGFTRSGTAGDGITLTGTATANDTVLVFNGTTEIGTTTASAGGAWSFTTGTLANGANTFTGLAVDAAGDVSRLSAALGVNISAAASAKLVAEPITANYAIINTNQVLVTGTAEANSTVNVFDGATLLGTTSASASGAWSYTTPSFANGNYTFTATATDTAGNTSAASNSIDPVVSVPPTVVSLVASGTGISNGNGDVGTGSVVTLTLNMSEAVTVTGGTPTLGLNDGGTATYTGGSGTNVLTFSYTVAAGDSTSDLTVSAFNSNGADIEDAGGNAYTGGGPNPAGVLQINMAMTPTVLSMVESPSSGDLNAGKTVTLTLNMNEAVTVAGGAPTLTLNDGGTATYSGGSGTDALTFSYTVTAGQNTSALTATAVNLNSATISGGAGTVANLTLAGLTQIGPQIDTTPPAAPVITSDTVNGTTATLSGTAEANSTVTVYDGKTTLGTTGTSASGTWTYTTPTLANGTQVFTATATDGAGNTSVASNSVDPTIGAITGLQAGTLSVANGTTVDMTGAVDNTGTIAVNASGNGADLAVVGSTTLSGAGKITLSNNAGNKFGSNGAPATLTNGNNTISGAGTIGDGRLTLSNQGMINANDSLALVVNTGSNTITNSGTLEATSSGGLDIDSNVSNSKTIEAAGTNAKVVIESTVTNTTSGLVLASGSGAQVDLDNATIAGGTLQTSGSNALIETVSGSADVLDGGYISSGSTVEVNSNTALTLDGTVDNSGTLLVNGGALVVDGPLNGGTTEMSGAGRMVIAGASSGNVAFQAKSTGELVLDQASSFTGEISGLGTTQSIDLTDIDFAAGVKISYASNNRQNTSGVLTIKEGSQTVRLEIEGSYTLENFRVASDGDGGTLLTDPTVVTQGPGNTPAIIGNSTVLEINAPDSGNVTFSGTTGTLSLNQPATFTGKVAGFGAQNAIDLSGIAFGGAQTTLGYSPNSNNTGGTLAVTEGAQHASIALLGSYMASSFVLESDNHGGTMVVTEAAQVANQSLLATPQHG